MSKRQEIETYYARELVQVRAATVQERSTLQKDFSSRASQLQRDQREQEALIQSEIKAKLSTISQEKQDKLSANAKVFKNMADSLQHQQTKSLNRISSTFEKKRLEIETSKTLALQDVTVKENN